MYVCTCQQLEYSRVTIELLGLLGLEGERLITVCLTLCYRVILVLAQGLKGYFWRVIRVMRR